MRYCIGEFIGQLIIMHYNERSMVVAIFQDEFIKRYLTSKMRQFFAKPTVFRDSIIECKIEDRDNKTDKINVSHNSMVRMYHWAYTNSDMESNRSPKSTTT